MSFSGTSFDFPIDSNIEYGTIPLTPSVSSIWHKNMSEDGTELHLHSSPSGDGALEDPLLVTREEEVDLFEGMLQEEEELSVSPFGLEENSFDLDDPFLDLMGDGDLDLDEDDSPLVSPEKKTRKRKRREPTEVERRVQPRRNNALVRSFKGIYGVENFWNAPEGGDPTAVRFETSTIELPSFRPVVAYEEVEEAVSSLQQRWLSRLPPRQTDWLLKTTDEALLHHEEDFDTAGHIFIHRPPNTSPFSSDAIEMDVDTALVEDLLHSEQEREEFTRLLALVGAETESEEEDISDPTFVRRHWRLEITERYRNILKSPFLDEKGALRIPTEEEFQESDHRKTYARASFPARVPIGMWRPSLPLLEYTPEGVTGLEVFETDPASGRLRLAGEMPLDGPDPRKATPSPRRRRRGPSAQQEEEGEGGVDVARDVPLFVEFDWEVVSTPYLSSSSSWFRLRRFLPSDRPRPDF